MALTFSFGDAADLFLELLDRLVRVDFASSQALENLSSAVQVLWIFARGIGVLANFEPEGTDQIVQPIPNRRIG
jgi:hypothetical protein